MKNTSPTVTLTKMLACSRWLIGSTKYAVTMKAASSPARNRAMAKWRRAIPSVPAGNISETVTGRAPRSTH